MLLPANPATSLLLPASPATSLLLPARPATGLLTADPHATSLLPARPPTRRGMRYPVPGGGRDVHDIPADEQARARVDQGLSLPFRLLPAPPSHPVLRARPDAARRVPVLPHHASYIRLEVSVGQGMVHSQPPGPMLPPIGKRDHEQVFSCICFHC